ncbi:tumor necrosis factor receptor superfamily member 1A [Sorex fumeus]|uniref:tumor necrosis factor receptor superfamily member 1A n=1 Tax=Sorex fumeus TaxID=62283 RepID=UPI0024AE5D9C|nr:tumor necrosis factor receptor superfamily member 1A [Sorex fumeus]
MGLPAVPGLLLTLVLQALLVAVQFPGATGQNPENKGNSCPPGKYVHPENNTICCTMCHKGTYLKTHCENSWMSTGCAPCAEGTYMAQQNFQQRCLSCSRCRKNLRQVEISACTAYQDTVCGCGPNQYRVHSGLDLFLCKNCSPCLNGTVYIPCGENQDTVCNCHAGFYLKKSKCESCANCKNNSDCVKLCLNPLNEVLQPEDKGTEVLLPLVIFFGLCLLFLLSFVLLCRLPRWKSKLASMVCPQKLSTPIKEGEPDTGKFGPGGPYSSPTFSPIPTFPSPNSENWPHFGPPARETAPTLLKAALTPVPGSPDPSPGPSSCLLPKREEGAPLPPPPPPPPPPPQPRPDDPAMLYAVVDGVPPTRWREFVRRLGLSEHEIERLELQNGRCLREAHYSMLAAWRQRTPRHLATLELLGKVLCDMDLRGCLEDIQEAVAGAAPGAPAPRPPR